MLHFMNETATKPAPPQPGDPRYGYAIVTSAVGDLIASVEPSQLGNATPCDEFTVKELVEHIVLVMRRVAAIGEGNHWSTIDEEAVDSGWHDQYRTAAHAVMEAWTDATKLDNVFEVPWGEIPGGPLFFAYTGELAVHGWDLAQATGQDFSIDDEVLDPPLAGARAAVPAQVRDHPFVPFGAPVVAPAGASTLVRLAAWYGRDVAG